MSAHLPTYRPEIDGLRAIAVVAVMIFHFYAQLLPSGYLGVDVFFVISGYVITLALLRAKATNLRHLLLDFYANRARRLMPALGVFVLLSSILICLVNPVPSLTLKTGLSALFGFANLYLLRQSANYFDSATELNIFTNTWSLGVEEQFYLLFPILLWITGIRQPSLASRRKFHLLIGSLSLVSLLMFIGLHQTLPSVAYFFMPARFWEIGVGCLLATLPQASLRPRSAQILTLSGILSLGVIFLLPLSSIVIATIIAVGATALLIATLHPTTLIYQLLTRQSLQFVGRISYSLYLWHWAVVVLSNWTIGVHWWSLPIQLILAFLLAIASYHWVERPLRYTQWLSVPWRSLISGFGIIALSAILILGVINPQRSKLFLGSDSITAGNPPSRILPMYPDVVQAAQHLTNTCNLTPDQLTGAEYQPKPIVDDAFLEHCLGTTETKPKIVLVGDSFAQISAPYIALIAHQLNYEFYMLFGYSCPFPFLYRDIHPSATQQCHAFDLELLQRKVIDSLKPNDILIVRVFLQKDQYIAYSNGLLSDIPPATAYDQAISALAQLVEAKGARLLLIGSNPILTPQQVQQLSTQWYQFAPTPDTISPTNNRETIYYHLIDQHLQQVFSARSTQLYFSLTSYLCNQDHICRISEQGKPLFMDDHHVNTYIYDKLYNDLFEYIRSNIL